MEETTSMRMRQAVQAQLQRAQLFMQPTLFLEAGALLIVPELLANRDIRRVLVVTTPGFVNRGTLEPFETLLEQEGIEAYVFAAVIPDPDAECFKACADEYRANRCEAMVAIGGGSVIDCAKVAGALVARPEKTVGELVGVMKVRHRIPLLIAVPTTAGTGSEVTAAAVLTDSAKRRKMAISDVSLIPKIAVLDPELLVSLSPEMTAQTGMSVLTHAIEAYINRYGSTASRRFARKAVNLVFQNLRASYENGEDVELRKQMLLASYFAGIAFTNARVGYVQALAHGVGGRYNVQHGLANAVLLPLVLEEYGEAAQYRLAELARVAGCKASSDRELAEAFIGRIRELNDALGIPPYLAELDESDIGILALGAETEGNPAYPVPVVWERTTFERVLHRALPQT